MLYKRQYSVYISLQTDTCAFATGAKDG